MATIINGMGKVGVRITVGASSGGGGTDADAQAFITAASITNSTQQSAVNTLVTSLKSAGIWSKMKAIYPFVGGTATSHKFNLKDPRDLDAAYRLVFAGGWTHSSTGALPNGTTGYANTFIKRNAMASNSAAFGTYIRNNDTNLKADLGVNDANWNTLVSGVIYSAINNSNPRYVGATATSVGFTHVSLTSASSFHKTYRNGTLFATDNEASSTTNGATFNFYLAAQNNSGSPIWYSNKEQAFTFFSDGLDATESANLYTAVQAFQTTLGRQV